MASTQYLHTREALATALQQPIPPRFPVAGLGGLFTALAAEHGERLALVQGTDRRSFADVDRRTNQLARHLEELDVQPGSFVAILLPNCPEVYEVALACWKVGAVPLPLSESMPATERQALEQLAEPVLTVEREQLGLLANEYVSCDDAPLPDRPTPRWVAMASGGSTGAPKLIVQEHAGPLVANSRIALGMRDGGVHLVAGPLYHTGPFTLGATHLFAGGTVVIMERFDAAFYLDLVEHEGVNWSFIVPTMMHRIMALPAAERERRDLSSLEVVLHGAAACPEFLKRRFLDFVGPARVWEYYAASEIPGALVRGDEWLERPGTVGVPWLDYHVLDDDGKPLGPGEVGELFVRPPSNRLQFSYRGAEPRRNGDLLSVGDMGYLDSDGYLYIADRRSDMIVTGGANVFPAEVEAALLEHPLVGDVVVVGLHDDEWGARVHAIVEPVDSSDPPSEIDLQSHVRERLTYYKAPKTYEFVSQLPRDPSGKIRRSQLRDERLRAEAVVLVERGVVCRVTLNRPEALNALNDEVYTALRDLVAELADASDTRVVVIAGAGRAFCSGADLRGGGNQDELSWAARRLTSGRWQRLLAGIEALPQVTVVRLQGHVVGGGLLLALSCDLRVGAPDLAASIPELALGLPLTWAGLPRMVRELGLPATRDLVMTGRVLDGAGAAACGLVQRVAANVDDLDHEVERLVEELLEMPPGPLAMTGAALSALGRELASDSLAWADPDLVHWSRTEPESRAAARRYVKRRFGPKEPKV